MTIAFPDPVKCGFFDEHVSIEGVRQNGGSVRGTFAACVMPAELADPFADSSSQSSVYKRNVLIAKCGDGAWNLMTPPQMGDTVLIRGKKWKAYHVNSHTDGYYSMEVRSC